MLHKIIVLTGQSNCGKSSTLNLVYDQIFSKGAKIIIPKKTLGDPNQKDFTTVLDYKGRRIAFYTMGDYSDNLINDAIEFYNTQNYDVDILVIAFSVKISWSKDVFFELSKYQSFLIPKTVVTNPTLESISNQNDAKLIISYF